MTVRKKFCGSLIWIISINLLLVIICVGCSHKRTLMLGTRYTQQGKPIDIRELSAGCEPTWNPNSSKIACSRRVGIWILDLDSLEEQRLTLRGANPAWSPDGSQIAYANNGIWIIEVASKKKSKLTTSGDQPYWSAQGEKLIYVDSGIWQIDLASQQKTCLAPSGINPCRLASANEILLEKLNVPNYNFDIWWLNLTSGEKKKLVPNATEPATSPDNTYLLYTADGIWLTPISGGQASRRLTVYGQHPQWSPNGKKIIFSYRDKLWLMDSPI